MRIWLSEKDRQLAYVAAQRDMNSKWSNLRITRDKIMALTPQIYISRELTPENKAEIAEIAKTNGSFCLLIPGKDVIACKPNPRIDICLTHDRENDLWTLTNQKITITTEVIDDDAEINIDNITPKEPPKAKIHLDPDLLGYFLKAIKGESTLTIEIVAHDRPLLLEAGDTKGLIAPRVIDS